MLRLEKGVSKQFLDAQIVKAALGTKTQLCVFKTVISFDANYLDFSICNHVMKHVQDDQKAMGECHRVLEPLGIVIFSFPLSGEPENREPNAGMSMPEIEAIVGQDHKHYYGYDFADKSEKFGFKVEIL